MAFNLSHYEVVIMPRAYNLEFAVCDGIKIEWGLGGGGGGWEKAHLPWQWREHKLTNWINAIQQKTRLIGYAWYEMNSSLAE